MGKALFLGDSHTCGYDTVPNKTGIGSYSLWGDNNYGEFYAKLNNKESVIYACPGSCNSVYPDWLLNMLQKYPDIDEVFVLLTSWNRFMIAFNSELSTDVVPIDQFTDYRGKKNNLVEIYTEKVFNGNYFQLFNKPLYSDYDKNAHIPVDYTHEEGLTSPDIRNIDFMTIKLFFDLNTHIEQRDFFRTLYIMDNICHTHDCNMYLFHMTERLKYPDNFEFYGKFKKIKRSPVSVEQYFSKKFIDHKKYFLPDQEHYNNDYHNLIAGDFLPWLKNQF